MPTIRISTCKGPAMTATTTTSHRPELTNGWEPDLPPDDSLLRQYLFHWAAYCDVYARAGGGRTHRTGGYAAADLGRPTGYFNSATLLAPPAAPTQVLNELADFFGTGHGEVLLWSAWPLPEAEVAAHGWRLQGHPPLLLRPPTTMLPPPMAPDVDVRPVRTAADLATWERVVIEGYPMPELAGAASGDLAHPSLLADSRLGFWVGYQQDRAVSVGTSFEDCGIASFALGVTRPEARRQGHWMRHARERLLRHPDVWMTGVFSDYSRPGAQSIGFLPIQRLTLWAKQRP